MNGLIGLLFLIHTPMTIVNQPVNLEARLLEKKDLPDDFKFPLLELGFKVVRVHLHNQSEENKTISRDQVEIVDPRGKRIPYVSPFEITPKIMNSKIFRRRYLRDYGSGAYPPYRPPYIVGGPFGSRVPTGPTTGGPRKISVDTATQIRSVLQAHQLEEATLSPGEQAEVLLYFKSKKKISKFKGSRLRLAGRSEVPISVP